METKGFENKLLIILVFLVSFTFIDKVHTFLLGRQLLLRLAFTILIEKVVIFKSACLHVY